MIGFTSTLVAGWLALSSAAAAPADEADVLEALRPFNVLVGNWRGTATPLDRESKRERVFWRETSRWQWSLGKGKIGLTWQVEDGKKFKGGFLTYRPERKMYELAAQLADGSEVLFEGALAETRLELDSPAKEGQTQTRLTVSLIGPNRFLYAISERPADRTRFTRSLETGNTREGIQFASGSSGPECIVTGGQGTIKVSHKGQTYYVCCTGCKEAFESEPERYIAAAKKE